MSQVEEKQARNGKRLRVMKPWEGAKRAFLPLKLAHLLTMAGAASICLRPVKVFAVSSPRCF